LSAAACSATTVAIAPGCVGEPARREQRRLELQHLRRRDGGEREPGEERLDPVVPTDLVLAVRAQRRAVQPEPLVAHVREQRLGPRYRHFASFHYGVLIEIARDGR
jgi:hypothetical protein